MKLEINLLKNENMNILKINSKDNIIEVMKDECLNNMNNISTLLNSQQQFIEQINKEFKERGCF